jgi:hypothetical protein
VEAGRWWQRAEVSAGRGILLAVELDERVDVDPVAARRAKVADLYAAGQNTHEIAAELGIGQTTVRRDLSALGMEVRAPGKPEKYPPVELGVCGTPGCTDPDCDLDYGTCHCIHRRCRQTTPIATRHDRRRGYIKGMHTMFVHEHDRLSEEGQRVQSRNMTKKMTELYADPRRKGDWTYSRHGSTRLYGHASRELAAEKAEKGTRRNSARLKNRVGRPSIIFDDPEVRDRVRILRDRGYTQQHIALVLSHELGEPISRDRVQRLLAKNLR